MPAEVESMMYVKEVPWHKLGKRLEDPVSSVEAIKEAGLDWQVKLYPIYTSDRKPIEKYKVLKRVTDNQVYNIVKERYNPIQNKEAFDFFDNLVGGKQAIYHTAGSIMNGARVWILAKLNNTMRIKGDQVDKYICLSNSHDGYTALQMFWTPIRVVCMNTLTMATSQATNKFYTRHTINYKNRMNIAKEILGLSNKFFEQWKTKAEYLAAHQLPPAEIPLLLNAAFNKPDSIKMEDIYNPIKVQMDKIIQRIDIDKEEFVPVLRGTKWEAYNAVVRFVDYERESKSKKEGANLNQAWFGTGLEIKNRAWNYLLKS